MLRLYSCLFLLSSLYAFGEIQAQSAAHKVDSILSKIGKQENESLLIEEIIKVWDDIKFNDPVLSRSLIDKAREIANQTGQEVLTDQVDFNEALLYYLAGEYEQARLLYKKSYEYWEAQGNQKKMILRYENLLSVDYAIGAYQQVAIEADSLAMLAEKKALLNASVRLKSLSGMAHTFLGNKMLAFQKFLPCITYYQETKDTARWADNLVYVGETLLDLHQTQKAREYFSQAILLYTLKNDQFYLIQALNDMGLAFLAENQLDSAQLYLEKSKKLNEKVQYSMLPTINLNLAKIHIQKGATKTAEDLLVEGLQSSQEQNNKRISVSLYNSYGELLFKTGKTNEALKMLQKGEQLAEETAYQAGEINAFLSLAKIYNLRGELSKASQYWQEGIALKDSLYKTESLRQQNELLVLHETEEKEKALLIQQQENITLKQAAKINQIRIRNLWIVSSLIAGIALLSFIIYRQINMRRLMLQEAKEKELEQELAFKQRELSTHALHLATKNQFLNEVKDSIKTLSAEGENSPTYLRLIQSIENDQRDEKDWENFARYFHQIYPDFEEKLQHISTELTSNEVRLITLLKMNLSYKEIAKILNITHDSVHKASYRLRKKLNLNKDRTLQQFILSL